MHKNNWKKLAEANNKEPKKHTIYLQQPVEQPTKEDYISGAVYPQKADYEDYCNEACAYKDYDDYWDCMADCNSIGSWLAMKKADEEFEIRYHCYMV